MVFYIIIALASNALEKWPIMVKINYKTFIKSINTVTVFSHFDFSRPVLISIYDQIYIFFPLIFVDDRNSKNDCRVDGGLHTRQNVQTGIQTSKNIYW